MATKKRVKKDLPGSSCKDHLGNSYISISQMCRAYDITLETYLYRSKKNWSLKKILTTPIGCAHDVECFDHKGTPFSSVYALCNEYNLSVPTFKMRIKNGWDLESALTTPVRKYNTWVITTNAKRCIADY